MKLVTFSTRDQTTERLGAIIDGSRVLDVAAAHINGGHSGSALAFSSMQALIEAGPEAWDNVRDVLARPNDGACLALDRVRLLAPLPRPVQVRDCLCFEEHIIGSAAAAMRTSGSNEWNPRHQGMHEIFKLRPIYYKANRFAITGPGTDVQWPAYSKIMDYELEMACVLGRTGKDISVADAGKFIFGYSIFNDFSARDTQAIEMRSYLGPSKSKDFDNANALGPCIVTADEFNPDTARMTVRVNGEVRSEGFSSTMKYKFADLISFISASETLYAGRFSAPAPSVEAAAPSRENSWMMATPSSSKSRASASYETVFFQPSRHEAATNGLRRRPLGRPNQRTAMDLRSPFFALAKVS